MSEATRALGGPSVRTLSIRVALTATAIVGAAYLVIAVIVAVFMMNSLTAQVDANLAHALGSGHAPPPSDGGGGGIESPGPDRPLGLPVAMWVIAADGTVVRQSDTTVDLPAADHTVTDPRTVTISGQDVRIMGAPVTFTDGTSGWVVVGQSMENVSSTLSTLVAAEIGIGGLLLLVVFLGSIAIGRRVAEPIERARQRQLDFTADASHELRTPLSVIEAQTSLALAQERDGAWYRRAFERVDHESRRMRRLVEDMLWLARFDATRGQPNAEPVDVGVLAAHAADRFGIVAEARRLRLEVTADPGSHVVNAPPEWLDRLLGVLLDNACKYSPDGGSVGVAVAASGNRISLTVDDSGRGIPPQERSRIFDRFHRATDSASGAGLGLAIADAIVRATNGRWQIGSSPSGGASMSVSWPRAFAGPREPASAAQRSSSAVESS